MSAQAAARATANRRPLLALLLLLLLATAITVASAASSSPSSPSLSSSKSDSVDSAAHELARADALTKEYVSSDAPVLAEVSSSTRSHAKSHARSRSRSHALGRSAAAAATRRMRGGNAPVGRPSNRLSGAASELTKSNAFCVICQFSIQRLHAELLQLAPGIYNAGQTRTGSFNAGRYNRARKLGKRGGKGKGNGGKGKDGKDAAAPAPAAGAAPAAPAADAAAAPAPSSFVEQSSSSSNYERNALASGLDSRVELDVSDRVLQESRTSTDARYGDGYHNHFDHGGIITPRRYRGADMLSARPARIRYQHLNTPSPDPNREAARAAFRNLYATVYQTFEAMCTRRMPFAYLPYCKKMLRSYRYIAQGIHYGDRPEQICVNGGFCDSNSYVRKTVHTLYHPQPGDAYAED